MSKSCHNHLWLHMNQQNFKGNNNPCCSEKKNLSSILCHEVCSNNNQTFVISSKPTGLTALHTGLTFTSNLLFAASVSLPRCAAFSITVLCVLCDFLDGWPKKGLSIMNFCQRDNPLTNGTIWKWLNISEKMWEGRGLNYGKTICGSFTMPVQRHMNHCWFATSVQKTTRLCFPLPVLPTWSLQTFCYFQSWNPRWKDKDLQRKRR